MPQVKSFDLKEGAQTPPGTGQPDNKPATSPTLPDTTAVESEIEKTLSSTKDEAINVEDLGDGTVVLPKEKFEKLQHDRDNYKQGLLSTKEKLKTMKVPAKAEQPTNETVPASTEFVTRKELETTNQKQVIDAIEAGKLTVRGEPVADEVLKDLNDNWEQIIKFYTPRSGKQTPDDIAADILDAHTLFRKRTPAQAKENTTVVQSIAHETGKPQADSKGGEKPQKRGIIPRVTPAKEWY